MMKKQDIKKLQRMIALTLSLVGGLYHMAWAAEALDPAALPKNPGTKQNVDSIDTNGTTMTITQTKGKDRAFISWETFNIGKDATVNIKQHSGADLLVNAVRGNSMSEIAGKLNATGNVALINPNGVIFMNGAQVNVGGLGVYATGYDATNQKFLASGGKEGRIEIQSGATINAGVKAVLANLKSLNIDPKDYAIAIDSTGEDGYTNRIHLIADGNVEIQGGSTLTTKDYTYIGPNASVGDEGFNVGVGAIGMGGKIYIRSDRDADDYGQVIITHGEKTNAPVMQSVNGVSIYTNADQVDADSTKPGVNAAVSRTESGDGATVTYYTKHDYKNIPAFDIEGDAYTDGTSVSVDGPGITADKLSNESDAKNKISTSYGGNGKTTVTTSLLVNNMDQLQDIEDENTGNLDGRYVPGRDINATDDAHSYIDDGVLYTKNSDGSVKKWSTADGVEITGAKSGGNLSKTVNGTTIGYSKDENKATTKLAKDTELSDGTKLSEETTLSNNGTVTSAENTQWSTTKGVPIVTDKTAGSAYTIQSDNKSVVDKDGLTSDTSAQTVTDGSSYTANISKNTVTHTSDNSVTDTSAKTVTKPAGTSDIGYTAEVTDGTDTDKASGTIAINGITYTVKNGSVGDTVTYQGSSVTTDKNTVTTGGVTTVVANDGTAADAVKEGTIADDTVTVNGTTTTVTDGTTSYQIITGTGTDAVTYTKGTTTASISGTEVTMGEVSADTSAGTVTKGDTTAAITGDTTGTVTYSGRDYTVSDGTVSTTDRTTGKTITVTGEDAANVLTIFSDAKTDLSNAKSIYSGYTTDAAKVKSLTKTLNAAIETLNAVMNHSTADETVLSNFSSAAKQLQGDTALFNTASAALTNATTALTQYNALQKAISDNKALEAPLKQAYDEFQSTHLGDAKIESIHSDKWDGGKGFNPIGDTTNPFTGTIDGFSGERVFGISNLTINRPEEDNVGLVAAAGTFGNSAEFVNLSLSNVSIRGKDNVGAIAGTLQNGSHISWSSTSGTVTGKGESIGGFAGLVDNSSMWDISNSATVTGETKAGGIAGTLTNSSTLTDVRNFAAISGTEDVGGIAGYAENGTILGTGSAIYNYANTYNNGTVNGTTNTGGIVGHAKGIYMYGVFNTNEDAPLSTKSQLIIGDDNKVIQRGDDKTDEKGNLISDAAGKTITDPALQSNYGRVTGVTNTGGLVGYLEDALDFSKKVTNINISSTPKTETDGTTTKEAVKDAPITNNVIDTSYNAGNITGTGDNTGGLVGQMTGGTLSNVYNADNNTVLREQESIPDAVKNAEIKDTSDNSKTYKYSDTKVSDCSNQDLTQYYSFFTVDDSGSRTYYYFIPISTTSGTTQKGAGGIYVDKNGSPVASLPSTKERYYFNRTFNKDANVTGTGKNTGGLVGSMTTTTGTTAVKYSAGSVIDSAYNAGTITGSTTDTTGGLVGSKDAASLINDSFYVIGKDVTNGKVYSNVNQAVGTSVTGTSGITDTGSLGAVESKKKYYVSDDSKRTNFPGVQQKTLTEKGETDSKTATYYEYTSGTNGSFYTDGTGSMDSISHIYPIETTGTTDSSTGKTTYTSTRSTTAAYTRQDDGTFKDTSGNKDTDGTIYNATYDTATRQIVLTPVSGSSSTAATVVLNAVLAARTANETWTIYEDQTRPLLTAFLNKASLSRTFSYDGTTHNLKTDDVANLYGRADFDGDAGKDVQLSNYQLSSNGVSSEYTYDNTSIWSPQHGYYMDPESTLVINPVNMSANLYGTRVYGDIFNTRGYYVCVPYTENGTKKYSFYKPVEESGKEGYTLLKDTDSDKALTDFFGDYEQTEDGLLKLAEEKGFYVLELNGFINGEGVDNLGKLITGLVSTLSNSSSTTTTSGSNLQHLFSSVTADTYLDAGIYNVTNAQITGLTATNQNYTINYGGTLTVKQAELYYTYDGSREYGAQNKDGEHIYTLVGVDSGKDETTGKYTSTHGFLKYWDLNDKTIIIKNVDGTETTITNPYKDFFKNNGDTYEINQDNIGVTGYTSEKTTTTTDVTTGKSTTVKSKDDTKSASLDDIYTNMTGTVNESSINKPSEDSTTSKVIGSYGDGAVNDDMYTHVLVDANGKPIGYKVTSFASSNKNADGTIQLYFKASSDTTNTADKNMQAAVDKFNQNYKLVWKEGGTYDKAYTIGDPEKPTPSGDAGIKTEAGKLTVNDSTFTILPKTATVTITGNRQYGDTMSTTPATSSDTPYSTTVGSITAGLSNEAEKYNINIDGLTNSDTTDILDKDKTILDKDKTTALLKKIDQKDGSAADAGTQINKYTNVKRDAAGTAEAQNINDFEKSKISVVNGDASTDKMNVTSTTTTDGTTSTTTYDNSSSILKSNNYDYILQDGTHQLKITPVDIHVKVSGGKTYGDFTSQAATDYTASVSYTSSVSGGKTYDGKQTGQVKLKTGEVADVVIANKLDEKSNAGTYTYDSSNPKDADKSFTISLTDDTANTDANDYNAANYNISFDTTYTIGQAELWYTYEGTRDYGADNTMTKSTFKLVGVDGTDSGADERVRGFLKSWDASTYGVGSDKVISLTTVGDDKNALYTMSGMANDAANKQDDTIRSITGGNSDNTYSHVIVDKDGNVIGYNLSSLGLSSDDKLSLADTAKNTAFKTNSNYKLVWKPQVQAGTDGKGTILSSQTTTASVKDAATNVVSTNDARKVNVGASTLTINPVALTVTVIGQRDYGDSMNAQSYTTDGTAGKDQYNISVTGDFANGETADSVLNKDNVEKMLESLENDTDATRENSNGETGKISKYTDVKRNADDKSKIDSYNLNVDSKDTSSTITLASKVKTDAEGKVTSIEHADKNVLNENNYDYVINDGTHTLTINPVKLTVDVKGESTYGKTDTKYTVTSTGAKNGETMTADSGTLSNLVANSAAGSYTANEWTDTTGAATSKATAASGKYLNTAELRTGKKTAEGTDTDKGIYQVQLKAGENSTFSANNYNITYRTTQVINPEKLTITIDGTKVYGSRSASDAAKITGIVSGDAVPNVKITDNMNQTLMDAGTYHHDWSSYAGISDKKESYTYVDTDGKSHTVDKDKASGVTDVDVEETSGFSFNNYDIDFKSTYTVTPRPLQLDVTSTSIYGDPKAGYTYRAALDPTGNTEEGLVGNQKFNPTDIKVSDDITEASDAGTYTHTAAGTSYTDASNNPQNSTYKGITAVAADSLKDAGNTGFKSSNYAVTLHQGTHTVKPRDLKIKITGEKTYGDSTSISGRDYTVSASGLQNNETIDFNDATVLHSAETGDRFSNAGEYHSSDGKGILGFEDSTLHGDGFKLGNYELTYDTVFTIDKRPVDVYMESRRMSGSPSSVRMDEPMTMRNVPEAHQGRFLADMQIIDTAPQVIAARDYPGFDGSGYLDLRFAGDIYRNYIIHRHTIYHILPDRMMKPGIYYAVQPERRPILDVMYFKVNGSEGINRWAGTEKSPYAGEIILNKDVTNSIQAATDIRKKPGLPARPGQELLKEEVTQAVPVVYTDGRKQDVRGRYHLAYENNHVVIYPASDDVSVPRLKERPVSSEIRRVMRVPYQGGEGEYHVAYADGIVQVYPQNETAYRLAQAKGKDEQLLLQSSLTSAVQELGASLEDIGAVYVYTK